MKYLYALLAVILLNPAVSFASPEISATPEISENVFENPISITLTLPNDQDQGDIISQCSAETAIGIYLQSDTEPFILSGSYMLPGSPAEPYDPVIYTFTQKVPPGFYSDIKLYCFESGGDFAIGDGYPAFEVINADGFPIAKTNGLFATASETLGSNISALIKFFIKFGLPVILIIAVFLFARSMMKPK